MSMNSITSLEDIRAEIVQKLRDSLELDPGSPAARGVENKSLEELRREIVEKAQETLSFSIPRTSSPESKQGYMIDIEDMRTRMLFYRIKNAGISRAQRDALSSFVQNMAIDKNIGSEIVKSVSEMVFFMETSSRVNRRNEMKTFPLERSVDDEMNALYKNRAQREAMKENLEKLRERISPSD